MKFQTSLIPLAIALFSGHLPAQVGTARNFIVVTQGNQTSIAPQSPNDPKENAVLDAAGPLVLGIECRGAADCTGLQVRLISTGDATGVEADRRDVRKEVGRWEFSATKLQGRTGIVLQVRDAANNPVVTQAFQNPAAVTEPPAAQTNTNQQPPRQQQQAIPATINALLTADCQTEIARAINRLSGTEYSQFENRARFLVAPNGNVLLRPDPLVDEDDLIEVTVVAESRLVPALRIRRTSAFRTPGVLNIVGGDQNLPNLPSRRAARPDEITCQEYTVVLGDFQPGRAEVTLSVLGAEGEVTSGSFDFGVNTLYAGAFSFGAINTWLRNPTYGLIPAPGQETLTDSIITELEDGAPRVLYTLIYTPFIWGRRDIEKDDLSFANFLDVRRLNPMFGIVLNNVDENFIAGGTYDVASAVYITFGAHFGKVRALNPESGFKVGDTFSGGVSNIPTVREWDVDGFLGVSLDLRAATQFFNKALGSATGNQ